MKTNCIGITRFVPFYYLLGIESLIHREIKTVVDFQFPFSKFQKDSQKI
jgi:hypothetical protein